MITVIGNLKGGSGKSTVTFNLAIWLAKRGFNIIAFDLDPQATLMDVVEVRDEEGYLPKLPVYRAENDPGSLIKQHQGEVLVDVGASNLWAMREAVNMADRILVPVTPSQADVWSTQRFLGIVNNALKGPKSPEIIGFINRGDTHRAIRETAETAEALSSLPGLRVLDTRLCQRTAFRRSFSEGLAVFEMEGRGKASQEFNRFAEALFGEGARARQEITKKVSRGITHKTANKSPDATGE